METGFTGSQPRFEPKKLKKILVANRGEIACRIIRTCKALGISTVAVYTASDQGPHVSAADFAIELPGKEVDGGGYLNQKSIIDAATSTACQAIIPGYGFLSENASFCKKIEEVEGLVFCGPTSSTIHDFGLKHRAIALAKEAGVPCVPGTGLLEDLEDALVQARKIGYPVMLKSSSGGGGMGLSVCRNESELSEAFQTVTSRSQALFGDSSVFLEKFIQSGRHIEVQIFGNGEGEIITFGERECSIQRRNQKIIEEAPSPFIAANPSLRQSLLDCGKALGKLANYRSAGTVEFILDDSTSEFYFLEVNTRLQVEHPVSEITHDVDLVALMLHQADYQLARKGGGIPSSDLLSLEREAPAGHAIECRLYAENPLRSFAPSPGLLQQVEWSKGEGVRIDTWIATGTVVSPSYDPLLAKVITHSSTRSESAKLMARTLDDSKVLGSTTNLAFLSEIVKSSPFLAGQTLTSFLYSGIFSSSTEAVEVIQGGLNTTIQDLGRPTIGFGVPIGGAADELSFKLANLLVGNEMNKEVLEITLSGCELKFHCSSVVALTGAALLITLDGKEVDSYSRIPVSAGSILKIGSLSPDQSGFRAYLAIKNGFPKVPLYLGSKATCSALGSGGYQGRKLLPGDTLEIEPSTATFYSLPSKARLDRLLGGDGATELLCMLGPFVDDEFLTEKGRQQLFDTEWTVTNSSSRTGIRLEGTSQIDWSRSDGGEGGSHPSNMLEFGYSPKGINMNGNTPVILLNDGPDLGGLSITHTLLSSEWKVGQIRPGSKIRFRPVSAETAAQILQEQDDYLKGIGSLVDGSSKEVPSPPNKTPLDKDWQKLPSCLLYSSGAGSGKVEIRAAGDASLMIEYGERTADVLVRCRIELLVRELKKLSHPGFQLLCPNLRSLTIRYRPRILPQKELVKILIEIDGRLPSVQDVKIPTREFTLPLTFDDPLIQSAVDKYSATVRDKAIYLPSNTQYVAKANGITESEVREYALGPFLVVACGFFAGTPILLPLDPRKRLVCQKYNPTRPSGTPFGAVGLGGSMAAIYGCDGGGGYQLCYGRTLPGWRAFADLPHFDNPWLFKDFDTLKFKVVSQAEYEHNLADFQSGSYQLEVKTYEFNVKDQAEFLASVAGETKAFREKQLKATRECQLEEEKLFKEWREEVERKSKTLPEQKNDDWKADPNCVSVVAPLSGSIWKHLFKVGDVIKAYEKCAILEAMKMEVDVLAPSEGGEEFRIKAILAEPGSSVQGGDVILTCVPIEK